jgi:hypothetical protein
LQTQKVDLLCGIIKEKCESVISEVVNGITDFDLRKEVELKLPSFGKLINILSYY